MEDSDIVQLGDLWVVRRHVPLLEAHGLNSADALVGYADVVDLGKAGLPSWRRRSRLELASDGGAATFYLKRYVKPPFVEQCRRLVSGWPRRSTAYVEWAWMHRLAAWGIAAVRPVAFGESMAGLRERSSVLLTEAVGGESLERWARGRSARCERAAPASLADFIARLHRRGCFHRDLYLAHVFCDETAGPDEAYRLIDLQRMIKPVLRRRRWVVKDLAALHYSTPAHVAGRSDRVRFVKRYLGVGRLSDRDKRLVRAIERKERRIAAHDGRRIARLSVAGGAAEGGR